MTTATLITRLLELPGEIAKAEAEAYHCAAGVTKEKNALKDAEAAVLSGTVPGKNVEERTAFVRIACMSARRRVEDTEQQEGIAKLALSALLTELSVLKTVARLLSRDTE